jgi:hypothetical protein
MTRATGPLQNRSGKTWSATEPVRGILGAPFGSKMDRYYYHGGTGERGVSTDWHQGAADRDGACAPKAHDATDPRQPGLSASKNLGPAKRACRKDHRAPGPSPSGPNSPGKPSGNRVHGRGYPADPKRASGPLMVNGQRSIEHSAMPSRAAIEIAKRFRKI